MLIDYHVKPPLTPTSQNTQTGKRWLSLQNTPLISEGVQCFSHNAQSTQEDLPLALTGNVPVIVTGNIAPHARPNITNKTIFLLVGTFKTPSVVRQLMSLTRDSDPNIKAVATLALAKAGKLHSPHTSHTPGPGVSKIHKMYLTIKFTSAIFQNTI